MSLLESEQKSFPKQFPQGPFFDDMGETKLIEDLVGYLPTEEKELNEEKTDVRISQKPIPPGKI